MATNTTDLAGDNFLSDLFKCVSAEALKRENIEKYDLKIYGSEDKIEQYGSDIAFIDISAETFEAEKREYNLVLKYGHTQKNVRNKVPVTEGFRREIEVYSKLIPCFQKFLDEKNLPSLSILPKCFLTKFSESDEIIVLENLKKQGYHTYNRKSPMNKSHIKKVLETYAQWHALSFALEDQNDQDYQDIKNDFLPNPWQGYLRNQLGELIDIGQETLYAILEANGENNLLMKYKQKIGHAKARTVLMDLMDMEESASVVLHGDCWNNNFLFKYQDNDRKKSICTKVALIDFQMTSLRSPIFDLSYLIYTVASKKELRHFKQLIEHYYFHLANHIRALGSSPEKLFPFSSFKIHWRRYGAYGAILSPFIAMYCFIDKEDTADFGVCQTLRNATTKNKYMKRVVAVARHFAEFEF
ncbi:uncharacterized protein [Euwallacea fornicatus]|uniref:uncharacterized protein n=1 Tax=Euwallacea fornicatus TaxID=995702 RepID=UPI00338D8B58